MEKDDENIKDALYSALRELVEETNPDLKKKKSPLRVIYKKKDGEKK